MFLFCCLPPHHNAYLNSPSTSVVVIVVVGGVGVVAIIFGVEVSFSKRRHSVRSIIIININTIVFFRIEFDINLVKCMFLTDAGGIILLLIYMPVIVTS